MLKNRIKALEGLIKPVEAEINPPLHDSLPSHWYKRVKTKVDAGGYEVNMTIDKFHEIRNQMLAEDDC